MLAVEYPPALAEVLADESDEGRSGDWLPVTLQNLVAFAALGGTSDMTPMQWRDLGDRYDRASRKAAAGLAPKAAESRAVDTTSAITDDIEAARKLPPVPKNPRR